MIRWSDILTHIFIGLCIGIIIIALLIAFAPSTYAETIYPKDTWKAVVGEAVGESEKGIIAVVLVFRNRLDKGMTLGSNALNRPDLDEFINRQPKQKLEFVKATVKKVFNGEVYDVTNGATYFENFKAFGVPKFTQDQYGNFDNEKYIITYEYGNHVFFKGR